MTVSHCVPGCLPLVLCNSGGEEHSLLSQILFLSCTRHAFIFPQGSFSERLHLSELFDLWGFVQNPHFYTRFRLALFCFNYEIIIFVINNTTNIRREKFQWSWLMTSLTLPLESFITLWMSSFRFQRIFIMHDNVFEYSKVDSLAKTMFAVRGCNV